MKDIIAGYHIFLAREGAEVDSPPVTVAVDARPDTDPEENYTRVANCETFEVRRTGNRLVRRSPDPGRFQDRAVITTNQQIEYVFGLQEWSDLTLAEGLLGGSTPASGVFVPNAAEEDIRGWYLIQGDGSRHPSLESCEESQQSGGLAAVMGGGLVRSCVRSPLSRSPLSLQGTPENSFRLIRENNGTSETNERRAFPCLCFASFRPFRCSPMHF